MKKTNKNKKESKIINVIAYGILFLVIAAVISNNINEAEQISGTAYIPVENYSYTDDYYAEDTYTDGTYTEDTYTAETYTEETYGTGSAYAETPAETYDIYEDENYSKEEYQVASSSWVTMEVPFTAEQLLGTWVDITDPTDEYPSYFRFYMENGQMLYEHYDYTPGNSIGFNIANEMTKWDYGHGLFSMDESCGWINCYQNEYEKLNDSLQYDGANGTLVQIGDSLHYYQKID